MGDDNYTGKFYQDRSRADWHIAVYLNLLNAWKYADQKYFCTVLVRL